LTHSQEADASPNYIETIKRRYEDQYALDGALLIVPARQQLLNYLVMDLGQDGAYLWQIRWEDTSWKLPIDVDIAPEDKREDPQERFHGGSAVGKKANTDDIFLLIVAFDFQNLRSRGC
jgi:hypothetical protein